MKRLTEENGAALVVGGVLGVIMAAVLATPFYGFGPVLVVIGALFVVADILRFTAGQEPLGRR